MTIEVNELKQGKGELHVVAVSTLLYATGHDLYSHNNAVRSKLHATISFAILRDGLHPRT
jgi:hypothetical protein